MRHAALRAVTESCLTKGRPRLGAVYPRHRGNPQGRRESAPTDRAVQEEEGSWVQCLKGLPLKINEKYTEIRHLWSGKFARKTQRAVFCLNESIWSNSLVRKRGGRARGRENAGWQNLFCCGDHLWRCSGKTKALFVDLTLNFFYICIKKWNLSVWMKWNLWLMWHVEKRAYSTVAVLMDWLDIPSQVVTLHHS